MKKCFYFDPHKRPSAVNLLDDPYVADFHNVDEEPTYPHGPLRLPIDDNTKLMAQEYRDKLYEEISSKRKEARSREKRMSGEV
jgi:mitogen-activated protein kinase 15